MLTRDEHQTLEEPLRVAEPKRPSEPCASAQRYAARVRRLKLSVAVWAVWTIGITTLWVVNEWQANGAFERFGHEGDPGQWNPTLWALGVGIPTLVVGIMALGVYFVRPAAGREALGIQRLRFKAKRLRRNPAAMIAPCTARGVPTGDAIPAEVEFLPAGEHAHVDRLMAEKYRVRRDPDPADLPAGDEAPRQGSERAGDGRVPGDHADVRPAR
jgi:hypothetical protein